MCIGIHVMCNKYNMTEDAKSKLNYVLRTLTDAISEENYTVRFANHLDGAAILFLFWSNDLYVGS